MASNKNIPRINSENQKPIMPTHLGTQKTVWTVGGGKGGTGKSFISTSLAIQLASLGEDVVLVDADLGGPNLHTFLGMKEANLDLGYFMTNRVPKLQDTLILTPFKGLRLVKGTENVLFMSNLNYFKKLKLLRHIRAFNARRVIIDIGTGSSYNSIDFFLLSNQGILVINPEPTSIENAYYFLKSCIIRILKSHIDHYKIQDLVKKIAIQIEDNSKSVYSFLNEIVSQDKSYAQILYRALKKFKPCLVVNRARTERDFLLGQSIVEVVRKYLAIDLNFLGGVPNDEKVHQSVKKLTPYMTEYPDSEVSNSVKTIAQELLGRDKLPVLMNVNTS